MRKPSSPACRRPPGRRWMRSMPRPQSQGSRRRQQPEPGSPRRQRRWSKQARMCRRRSRSFRSRYGTNPPQGVGSSRRTMTGMTGTTSIKCIATEWLGKIGEETQVLWSGRKYMSNPMLKYPRTSKNYFKTININYT